MFMALLWWDKEIVFKGLVLWLLHLVPYISFCNNPDSCHPGRLLPPLPPRSLPKMQKLGAAHSYTPLGGLSPEGRSEPGTPIPDLEGVGERGHSENSLFTNEKSVAWMNSTHTGTSEVCRVPAETSCFPVFLPPRYTTSPCNEFCTDSK